uniref:Autophagy protein ATG17-like domain-containing protein n=1 Tax=Globisporangium ultimum (strain ATCC 200006 / CBS 805.95 / DAOM BR144) TaxID=431595 RepID=K3WL11_GLOUD
MRHEEAAYFAAAIRDVTKTIAEKREILGRMLNTSTVKFENARQVAQETIIKHTPLIVEMDRVFARLQSTPVDPSMVAGDSSKTLFDFVDAETVQSLQQDAIEQTREYDELSHWCAGVEELLGAHEHALERIAAMYQFFQSFEIEHGKEMRALVDVTVNDGNIKQLQALYDITVSFFVDMEQCDRFLRHYFTTINDIHPHYDSLFAETQTLFDELRSLRDFYHHFSHAYLKLTPELERRREYERKLNQIIEETKAKLAKLDEEESALRVTFCQDHARFLPSSLCPQIKYLPDQYDIVRVEEDGDGSAVVAPAL